MNKVLITAILALPFIYATSCEYKNYDSFAKCLTEEGAKMYGTGWCPHCQDQKREFGSSFKYINYKDCDKDKATCSKEGIEWYPTWEIKGIKSTGQKSVEELASISGCSIDSKSIDAK